MSRAPLFPMVLQLEKPYLDFRAGTMFRWDPNTKQYHTADGRSPAPTQMVLYHYRRGHVFSEPKGQLAFHGIAA